MAPTTPESFAVRTTLHPAGAIDLIVPLEGEALFDGRPAGCAVMPAGSAHRRNAVRAAPPGLAALGRRDQSIAKEMR